MTARHEDTGRGKSGTHDRPAAQEVPTQSVNALAGSVLGNLHILMIAGVADNAGLGEQLDLAAPPDAPSAHLASKGNSGDATKRTVSINVLRCRVIWRLVAELFATACERELPEGAARRRPRCHMRQIAMYLSHVVLSVPYRTIAIAFSRDRTTVMHACSVVEDRRDDDGYDRFVEQCERCIEAVFAPLGLDDAEL